MNILVISQYFWPENFRVNDLVEDLLARGHTVTVLTGQPNYPAGSFFEGYGWFGPREETFRGARVLRVPLVARGKRGVLRMVANYLSFALFATLAAWARLPKKAAFDRIFVFEISPVTVGIPAVFARRKFKAPMLFWVLDLWPETLSAVGAVTHPFFLKCVGVLVRWIYTHCDRILVASRAYTREVERYGGVSDTIRYFPNWGEPMFDTPAPIAQVDIPPMPAGIKILYAGNIGDAQDFQTVLDAAEQLKDHRHIHWVLVGDGRMAPWVNADAAKRGLSENITMLGQQPLEKMPAYFAAADVLFLSLKGNPVFAKTIPGKLQSYLAAGKPVLAMLDGEGARVLEESGAGIASPAGDANALANAVLKLTQMSQAERELLGTHGRHYYEAHFARNHVLSQLESWMKELS